jgi:hypothetical protein
MSGDRDEVSPRRWVEARENAVRKPARRKAQQRHAPNEKEVQLSDGELHSNGAADDDDVGERRGQHDAGIGAGAGARQVGTGADASGCFRTTSVADEQKHPDEPADHCRDQDEVGDHGLVPRNVRRWDRVTFRELPDQFHGSNVRPKYSPSPTPTYPGVPGLVSGSEDQDEDDDHDEDERQNRDSAGVHGTSWRCGSDRPKCFLPHARTHSTALRTILREFRRDQSQLARAGYSAPWRSDTSSIPRASSRSAAVTPPAECVESENVSVRQRMSMSG